MVNLVHSRHFDLVALGYHFVLESPAGAAGELGHDDVAVAEEVDVKVDVVDGLRLVSGDSRR
jgi:hypothetical protein